MSQLISLQVTKRVSVKEDIFATPVQYGFDVEDIVVPIKSDGEISYFETRQKKGTMPTSRFVGKTKYEVADTLSEIALKSNLFAKLTVLKRRNVDVNSEFYVFVTSRMSENLKVSPNGGTIFFYQEDGDTENVEYEVEETIDQIIIQSTNPEGGFVEITYIDAVKLAEDCSLVEGAHYKITDRADAGIILLAVSSCQFSLEGEGIFLNPDFQDNGDYSGLTSFTGVSKVTNYFVWTAALEAANNYGDGDIVFRDGLQYQMTDFASKDLTEPSINPGYTLLPKSETNVGYIQEVDFILYDFFNDVIIKRICKRGNEICKEGIDIFQWGNDVVNYNTVKELGKMNCINSIASAIDTCIVSGYCSVVIGSDFEGTVSANFFDNQQNTITFGSGSYNVYGCTFGKFPDAITLSEDVDHNTKEISTLGSTFECTLDLTDGADYDLGTTTLTIPTNLNYIGKFFLTGVNCTIDKIIKDWAGNVEYTPRSLAGAGVIYAYTFNHAAVATLADNELVSDAGVPNVVNQRAFGRPSDSLKYETIIGSGGNVYHKRINGEILA